MKLNSFSIIVPCYNQENEIGRCLQSLVSQSYDNFEVIVIDDGSTDGSREVIKSFMGHKKFRAFFVPKNQGKLNARNIGMILAKNDWICWLDGDDEYMSNYLEVYNDEINRSPKYKIFNSGMLVKDREIIEGERFEKGWRIISPLDLKEAEDGMEGFGKGQIGTGSFVFHKDLMWFFPNNVKDPYGESNNTFPEALVRMDEKFFEICTKNKSGSWEPLGNPWGDDYSYFWYLTRTNKSKMINCLLYIQHIKK